MHHFIAEEQKVPYISVTFKDNMEISEYLTMSIPEKPI